MTHAPVGRRAAALGVVAAHTFLSLWRLGVASWNVDELIYARAGPAYLRGDFTANLEHPPLGKYLIGLPQVLLFESTSTARLAGVAAGAAVGVCLFLLVREAMGFWTGLAAWAAWVFLPLSVGLMKTGTHLDMVRLERFAMLDVFAAAFMAVALVTGWRWINGGGIRPALLTGVAIGLATASKLPGATVGLVVVGTAIVVQRHWRVVWHSAVVGLTAVCTFALTYLPMGRAGPDAIRFMVDHQLEHASTGHSVFAGGRVHTAPPWWVFGAYQVEADGWVLTGAVVVAVVAALVLERRRILPWYLLAAVLVPLAALTLSPVVIRHYRYIALPATAALIGIGLVALFRRSGWTRLLGALVCAPLLLAAARDAGRVATLDERDYARLAQVLVHAEPGDPVVVRGPANVSAEYLSTSTVLTDLPVDGDVVAVALDPPNMLLQPDPELEERIADLGFVETEMGRLRVFLHPRLARAAGIDSS